jgi:hypothetical protein
MVQYSSTISEEAIEELCDRLTNQLAKTRRVHGNGDVKTRSLEKLRKQIEWAYRAVPCLPVTVSRPVPHLPAIASEALRYYLSEVGQQR